MPYAASEGANIYFEETGTGAPIVFVHEYRGDHRSWEPQVRQLSRSWRCIVMAARGYPPSDCPAGDQHYGQDLFIADVLAVMDSTKLAKAHLVGLSMGGYTVLRIALDHPDRLISATSAAGGSGSTMATRQMFIDAALASAADLDKVGRIDADAVGHEPARVQLLDKDLRGWRDFVAYLAEHPAGAAASTLRKVQALRPSLYDFEAKMVACKVPTLLMVGDEDEPCLDVNLWMKRTMTSARLSVFAGSGHAINLEEPALFNQQLEAFLNAVERGTWRPRDPRAAVGGSGHFLGHR